MCVDKFLKRVIIKKTGIKQMLERNMSLRILGLFLYRGEEREQGEVERKDDSSTMQVGLKTWL